MWWEDAYCLGADTEIFYQNQPQKAKKVIDMYCNKCPVRLECLEDAIYTERSMAGVGALLHNNEHPIRGGLTAYERYNLIKIVEIPSNF